MKSALSDEEHFLIKPITVSCGHSACKNCIPIESNEEIKCKICYSVSEKCFSNYVSKGAQQALKFCFDDIFQILEKETSVRLSELKGIYLNESSIVCSSDFVDSLILDKIQLKDEILNVAFDYIKEEIDVRVESVKIQVENIGNRVKKKLINYEMRC